MSLHLQMFPIFYVIHQLLNPGQHIARAVSKKTFTFYPIQIFIVFSLSAFRARLSQIAFGDWCESEERSNGMGSCKASHRDAARLCVWTGRGVGDFIGTHCFRFGIAYTNIVMFINQIILIYFRNDRLLDGCAKQSNVAINWSLYPRILWLSLLQKNQIHCVVPFSFPCALTFCQRANASLMVRVNCSNSLISNSLANNSNLVEFPEDSRSDRMLFLQEAILARFGFLPCVLEEKFNQKKDVSSSIYDFKSTIIISILHFAAAKGISVCALHWQHVRTNTVLIKHSI